MEAAEIKREYLSNTPFEEAAELFLPELERLGFSGKEEIIGYESSVGRITSEAVYAKISVPHYNSCASDGIALCAAQTQEAGETTPLRLSTNEFLRVSTGDPLPDGCDCVIMEDAAAESEDGGYTLYQAAAPWRNIRQVGEDICRGEMILPCFTDITPATAGAFAAAGVLSVSVLKKPVVGVIPVGNKLIAPCENPKPGEIQEFNSVIFSGMLEGWKASSKIYPIVRDDLEQFTEAVGGAARECDLVLICTQTQTGDKDYTVSVMESLGRIYCRGFAVNPGKSAALGLIGKTPVIGIPGHHLAGMIVLEKLVKPIIDMWYRSEAEAVEELEANVSRTVVSSTKYKEFVRAKIGYVNGRATATPLIRGTGFVSSFARTDAIIEIPQDSDGFEAGEQVNVRLLRKKNELEKTLTIVGSHDPLLDEAADILRRHYRSAFISSCHAGSMGGIMAIKRGEALAAGIHLLDESTGTYNKPFVGRHFPSGGVFIVPCVKRIQGFIVKPGNPNNVKRFSDIAEKGLNYVNRQNGSGTRILCDYLLRLSGISPQNITGYGRIEYTHTAAAAAVASGGADAALGIYSSARLYGLDFIPVREEEYDLLIDKNAVDLPVVQHFMETLRSPEFRSRLTELGGYAWI